MAKSDVFAHNQLVELKVEFERADAHARWTAERFYSMPKEKGADFRLAQTEFQLACKVRDALANKLVELGVNSVDLEPINGSTSSVVSCSLHTQAKST